MSYRLGHLYVVKAFHMCNAQTKTPQICVIRTLGFWWFHIKTAAVKVFRNKTPKYLYARIVHLWVKCYGCTSGLGPESGGSIPSTRTTILNEIHTPIV